MEAILFGSKEEWEPALQLLMSLRNDIMIVGLCDPFEEELPKDNDAVFTQEEMMAAYNNGIINAIITTDESAWTWNSYLHQHGVEKNYTIPTKYYQAGSEPSAHIEDLVRHFRDIKPEIHNLEFQLADHCNLNCKACAHFSNLVREPVFADRKQFQCDLYRLAELFDNIKEFYLMGGEPFLNEELGDFCRLVKQVFPFTELTVVTNGILIPLMQEQTIQSILDTNTRISISNYSCIDEKRIIHFLHEHSLMNYEIRNGKEVFTKNLNPYADDDVMDVFRRCSRRKCTFLDKGKVAACTQPFTIRYFNEYFDEHFSTVGGISLYEDEITGFEILERLQQPMEACQYCTIEETVEWEASKGKIAKSDWCVKE